MFEIGWTELLVIGVVALIVIGPKDLPDMFRQLGRFTAKMRSMARDFQRAMDQAANDSGLNDVARDLKAAGSMKSTGLNAVKDAAAKFEKWDPIKNAARPTPAKAAEPLASDPAVEPKIHGPATQELIDTQARRAEIIRESTEKLKAVTLPKPVPVAELVSQPARKPRRKAVAVPDPSAAPPAPNPPTPKKPRKTKAGDT